MVHPDAPAAPGYNIQDADGVLGPYQSPGTGTFLASASQASVSRVGAPYMSPGQPNSPRLKSIPAAVGSDLPSSARSDKEPAEVLNETCRGASGFGPGTAWKRRQSFSRSDDRAGPRISPAREVTRSCIGRREPPVVRVRY